MDAPLPPLYRRGMPSRQPMTRTPRTQLTRLVSAVFSPSSPYPSLPPLHPSSSLPARLQPPPPPRRRAASSADILGGSSVVAHLQRSFPSSLSSQQQLQSQLPTAVDSSVAS